MQIIFKRRFYVTLVHAISESVHMKRDLLKLCKALHYFFNVALFEFFYIFSIGNILKVVSYIKHKHCVYLSHGWNCSLVLFLKVIIVKSWER